MFSPSASRARPAVQNVQRARRWVVGRSRNGEAKDSHRHAKLEANRRSRRAYRMAMVAALVAGVDEGADIYAEAAPLTGYDIS